MTGGKTETGRASDEEGETIWAAGGGITHEGNEGNVSCGIGKKPRIVGGSVALASKLQIKKRELDERNLLRWISDQ